MSTNSGVETMYQLVSTEIRRRRKERDWTLRDLATASNISLGYISEIERGMKEPSLATIVALAGALDVHVVFRLEDAVA